MAFASWFSLLTAQPCSMQQPHCLSIIPKSKAPGWTASWPQATACLVFAAFTRTKARGDREAAVTVGSNRDVRVTEARARPLRRLEGSAARAPFARGSDAAAAAGPPLPRPEQLLAGRAPLEKKNGVGSCHGTWDS